MAISGFGISIEISDVSQNAYEQRALSCQRRANLRTQTIRLSC